MKDCNRETKRKYISVITTVLCSVIISILGYNSILGAKEVHAQSEVTYNDCLANSGNPDVLSVQEGCNLCLSGSFTAARGTMWFNNSPGNSNSDVVEVTDPDAQTIPIQIWGSAYSCRQNINKPSTSIGYYVWFAQSGQYIGDSSKGSFPGRVDFVYRGSSSSVQLFDLTRGSWSENYGNFGTYRWTQGYTSEGLTLNVPGFKEYAEQNGTVTDLGDGRKSYEAFVSVNRCYNAIGAYKNRPGDGKNVTCYGDDSRIKLVIGETEEPADIKGIFSSKSFGKFSDDDGQELTAESALDGVLPGYNERNATSMKINDLIKGGEGGTLNLNGAGIAVTRTENGQIKISFWHQLFYHLDPPESNFKEGDTTTPSTASTHWNVTTEYKTTGKISKENRSPSDGGWTTLSTHEGDYTVDDNKKPATSEKLSEESVTVDLDEGVTALVCSTIRYKTKTVNFTAAEGHSYTATDAGDSGASQACVAVFQPPKPGGNPWSGSSGVSSADPTYAGEVMPEIGWDVYAWGTITDRLMDFQVDNYLIRPTVNVNDGGVRDILDGGSVKNDPFGGGAKDENKICKFSASIQISGIKSCEIIVDYPSGNEKWIPAEDWTPGNIWHELNTSETIIAPNEVGRKHANTAGYFYEVWECVPVPGGCVWTHMPKKDYWSIYNSAVRTIAKKPSVAFWNGSLFTGGAVSTLLAPRYTIASNAIHVTETSVHDSKTHFGSWSEYLAVVGQGIQGLTSGTILSGGSTEEFDLLKNSPLTIANKTDSASELGHSGLSNDLILRQRLQDYFFSNNNTLNNDIEVLTDLPASTEDIDKTYIISKTGNLKIDHDIKLKNDAHDSIYTLPQVLIYASGNIEIGPDVEQIDAWLIAGETLDTCDVFAEEETSARITNATGDGKEKCFKSLTINGPVFAKNVKLNRTYGADGISNEDKDLVDTNNDTRAATAEVFNLSADSYLWAYAQSGRYDSSYSEVYSRELPPRY